MTKQSFSHAVMQNAAGATGNGTSLDCDGFTASMLQVTGTFTATITFEGTVDGTNWVAIGVQPVATPFTVGSVVTTAAAAGMFFVNLPGLSKVRARISAYTSGAITVHGRSVAN